MAWCTSTCLARSLAARQIPTVTSICSTSSSPKVISPQARLAFGIFDLENELSEIFGRKVDLVSKKYLHPLLLDNVIAEAQELYAA